MYEKDVKCFVLLGLAEKEIFTRYNVRNSSYFHIETTLWHVMSKHGDNNKK